MTKRVTAREVRLLIRRCYSLAKRALVAGQMEEHKELDRVYDAATHVWVRTVRKERKAKK